MSEPTFGCKTKKKKKYLVAIVLTLLCFFCISSIGFGDTPTKPDDKKTTSGDILFKPEDASAIRDQMKEAETTQLKIRALSAEVQLAQVNLKTLQEQLTAIQQKATATVTAVAGKAGVAKEKLTEYDLVDENGQLLLRKKVKQE